MGEIVRIVRLEYGNVGTVGGDTYSRNVSKIGLVTELKNLSVHGSRFTCRTGGRTAVEPMT